MHQRGSALYARTSTDEQREKKTIDSQVETLEKLITEKNENLIRKYIDDGFSGATLDRPALDQLRDDAKNEIFKKLYIYSPDRLARELYLQLLIVKELRRYGIEIVFLNQKFSDSPSDQLLFQMLGAISEFERAQILERTRRGKLHKARQNIPLGGTSPYGYKYIKKAENQPGRYEIDTDQSENVRLLFRTFNSPHVTGVRTLAKELHRMGIRNYSGHTRWGKSSLARLLTNQTYVGLTHYNKSFSSESVNDPNGDPYRKKRSRRLRPREEWIPIQVPPIISNREFELAQEKLKRNSRLSNRNAKYQYLLKGLIYCTCSKRIYGYPCHGIPRYKCSDKYLRYPLPRTCSQGTVDTETVDTAVWNAFLMTLARPEVLKSKLTNMVAEREERIKKFEAELIRTKKKLQDLDEDENRFLEAYAQKAITVEQLKRQNDRSNVERQNLRLAKARLERESKIDPPTLQPSEVEEQLKKVIEMARNAGFKLKKQILTLFVSQVTIGDGIVRIRAYFPSDVSTESVPSACNGLSRYSFEIEFSLKEPEKLLVK